MALVFKFLVKSKKHFSFSQQFHILGLNNWRELRQEANEGGKKETLLMERPRHHREKKISHMYYPLRYQRAQSQLMISKIKLDFHNVNLFTHMKSSVNILNASKRIANK